MLPKLISAEISVSGWTRPMEYSLQNNGGTGRPMNVIIHYYLQ